MKNSLQPGQITAVSSIPRHPNITLQSVALALLLTCASVFSEIDTNSNGLSDLWEALHQPLAGLDVDADGDSFTTRQEEIAGTDPNDPASNFNIQQANLQPASDDISIRFKVPTVAGKTYQLHGGVLGQGMQDWPPSFPGSGAPQWIYLQKPAESFLAGAVFVDLWRSKPAGVTSPTGLLTTSTPPDTRMGLAELSSAAIDFPYAALRVRGHLRHFNGPSGMRFQLASKGPSAFQVEYKPGDGPRTFLTHSTMSPRNKGYIIMNFNSRHAFTLTYLPDNPADALVWLKWKFPNENTYVMPNHIKIIGWEDTVNATHDLLAMPNWAVNFKASEMDSDGDNVCDWEELKLGLSPIDTTTTGNISDYQTAQSVLFGQNMQVIERTRPAAGHLMTENGSYHPVEFTRTKGQGTLTIPVIVEGEIERGDFGSLALSVTFTDASNSKQFWMKAKNDGSFEPVEQGIVTLAETPGVEFAEGLPVPVSIRDGSAYEPRLYFATFQPQGEAVTEASGFASILLSADRRSAVVASQVNGLETTQVAAHLHDATTDDIVHSLPLGNYSDHLWQLDQPETMEGPMLPGVPMDLGQYSLQDKLDLLVGGELYINVHSADYPGGEVLGTFSLIENTEFQPPDPLPPVDGSGPTTVLDAHRFLQQSSFGPLWADVTNVSEAGLDAYLKAQFDSPIRTSSLNYQYAVDSVLRCFQIQKFEAEGGTYPRFADVRGSRNISLVSGWLFRANHGKDQLRQRMANALSQIFVISINNDTVNGVSYGTGDYYDMLADNAFGSFRELLGDVARHPIMGAYLSHLQNEKENTVAGTKPDENFAREIMQLFSIGLLELNLDGSLKFDENLLPVPTYTNEDITQLARVFTGLSVGYNREIPGVNTDFTYGGSAAVHWDQGSWTTPMIMFGEYHDTGAKQLFGGSVKLPAKSTNQSLNDYANADLDRALDAICDHPNVPPFMSRLLIQRLVTSNPSPGYIYRVAEVFKNTDGDLRQVLTAILLDQEARNPEFYNQPTYGKLKEPLLVMTEVCRVFHTRNQLNVDTFWPGMVAKCGTDLDSLAEYPNKTLLDRNGYRGWQSNMYAMYRYDANLGQSPLQAPSVFNYYSPNYRPSGTLAANGLVAPEFQIATDANIMIWLENLYRLGFSRANPIRPFSTGVFPRTDLEDPLVAADDITLVLDWYNNPNNSPERIVQEMERRMFGEVYSAGGTRISLELHNELLRLARDSDQDIRGDAMVATAIFSPDFMIQR